MSVYNAVGEGPTSPPQEVFVGEAGTHTSCHFCHHSLIQQHLLARRGHLGKSKYLIQKNVLLMYGVCWLPTVPTAPPQNVAIQSATATQLDVTWDPPPVDAQNGDIQGYKVRFTASLNSLANVVNCHIGPRSKMSYESAPQ